MTATVHVVQSLFRPSVREDFAVEPGESIRAVAVRLTPPEWGEDPDVALVLNGGKLTEADVDAPLQEGADLAMYPEVAGIEIGAILVHALIAAVIGTAINFAISAIMGRPKLPRPRGDEESASHTWDGIQTNWAAGFRIPIPYGIIRCGGQVIAQNFDQLGIGDEIMGLHIVLGEGPIARIGGVDLTQRSDVNNLGGLFNNFWNVTQPPTGIRLNGTNISTRDARIHMRAGTLFQTPVPGALRGTTVYVVNKAVKWQLPQTHIPAADTIQIQVRLRFDAGLYQLTGNGATKFKVSIGSIFLDASGQAIGTTVTRFVEEEFRAPFHFTFRVSVPQGFPPGVQLQVTRQQIDDQPGANTVSAFTWTEAVEEIVSADLAFPTCAQMAIELRAAEQIQGTQPNITVPIWGLLVRWKLAGIWQEPAFQHVASGTWPGRNPAWIAHDFLTKPYGLGKWFSAAMIDEDSLEQWALWCDELVDDGNGGTHPRHQFDDIIDRGESGWDVLLNICRAGRCIPWLFANRLSFKYEHPDVALHPRPVVQIFAESNVEDLTIAYKDRRSRPNIYDAQILDETLEWETNVISQEDPDAFHLNEPWKVGAEQPRRELVEMHGITRPAHARREILWMHATNRLSYSEATLVAAVDAIVAEIGDWVGLQHDVPRFFDTETHGWRTTRAATAEANIYLDHEIVLEVGHFYEVYVTRSDTTPQRVTIMAAAGTYPADTAISLLSAQTYRKGAVVAFGEVDKSAALFQVTNYEWAEDMKIRVSMVRVDPAAFNLETVTPTAEDSDLASAAVATIESTIPLVAEPPQVLVAAHGAAVAVGWTYPPERRGPARVYIRPKVAAASPEDPSFDQSNDQRWSLVYEGQGTEVTV